MIYIEILTMTKTKTTAKTKTTLMAKPEVSHLHDGAAKVSLKVREGGCQQVDGVHVLDDDDDGSDDDGGGDGGGNDDDFDDGVDDHEASKLTGSLSWIIIMSIVDCKSCDILFPDLQWHSSWLS